MAHSPADELIDHVDTDGRVIGTVTRAEMRRRKLPHRCVYLLVFNTRGEIFIHQRTSTKDVFPAYWDLTIGGVLAAGESFLEGARREGHEELGVELEPIDLFPFQYGDPHTELFAQVFRATHDGPFRLQVEEIVRGEFVSPADLPRWFQRERFCPDGLAVWAEFCRRQEIAGKT